MSELIERAWNAYLAGQVGELLARLGFAIVAALAMFVAARMALGATRQALARTRSNDNVRLLISRIIQFAFLLLAAIWILSILGIAPTAVVTVLGVAGLAVSLALQDVLRNLVAGLYILIERPFSIGEHIEFRTFSGVVESIELRTTALRTVAGQRVVIPNAMLFAETLVNRSTYGRQLVKVRIAIPLKRETGKDKPVEAHEAVAEPARTRADAGGRTPGTAPSATPGATNETVGQALERQLVADVLSAVRAVDGAIEAPPATVAVEAMTNEKLTLRAELWARDAREAAPEVAWEVRGRIPRADITILE
ncbi:MAG: mechanosensitive ion channel [Chloroflexi bacterium]|nr:mechanosensitive ion channel [Chloroflexota bacterium]